MKKTFTILLFITTQYFAQISEITRFPLQNFSKSVSSSKLFEALNGNLIMFWSEGNSLLMAISSNNGISWNSKIKLADDVLNRLNEAYSQIDAILTDDNRIFLAYTSNNKGSGGYYIKYLFSSDSGNNWTASIKLSKYQSYNPSFNLSKTISGDIWFLFWGTYIKSTNNGSSWYNLKLLINDDFKSNHANFSIQSLHNNTLILFYREANGMKILYRISNNDGVTWGEENILIESGLRISSLKSIQAKSGEIVLAYIKEGEWPNGNNLFFLKNQDGTTNWSEEEKLTNYVGDDNFIKLTKFGEKIGFSFSSDRWVNINSSIYENYGLNIWYGIIGESIDVETPPLINRVSYYPTFPTNKDSIRFSISVYDEDSLKSMSINIFYDGIKSYSLTLTDSINRIIYLDNLEYHDIVEFTVSVTDMQNLTVVSEKYFITFKSPYGSEGYLIDVNNLKMPVSRNGVLAEAYVTDLGGVVHSTFDELPLIYSSGFFISGLTDGKVFSNGIFEPTRITGIYNAGNIGSNPGDGRNVIYVIKSSDQPFGWSWQNWKNAVFSGAHFYDGDNNGLYNPIDKNNNGAWDIDEDKPDLIGDVTAWSVFNDGENGSNITQFSTNVGIEIKQTIFASKALEDKPLQNTVFVRYEIENKSKHYDLHDSVYFGIVTDPDIGKTYSRDLVGSDTSLNGGYAYKIIVDSTVNGIGFGNNAPSLMVQILEGPHSFIPGETFIDNNRNLVFDFGDVAIDSAMHRLGPDRGVSIIPGAKNLSMTNFFHFFRYGWGYSGADNITEMRNALLPGIDENGNIINVCELNYGNGETLNNCRDINNSFMYSGNPVDSSGWLCTIQADTRMLIGTGPFKLEKNKPITIIAAFIVARGDTPLNSVTIVKDYASYVSNIFKDNFVNLPVGVIRQLTDELPTKFELLQNYPNPFNPSTTIKYSIPVETRRPATAGSPQNITLKVYDILGREVAILVNQQQKAGSYEVSFDASNLTSGVYIYSLKSGSYYQSRKMILIK